MFGLKIKIVNFLLLVVQHEKLLSSKVLTYSQSGSKFKSDWTHVSTKVISMAKIYKTLLKLNIFHKFI